MSTFAAASRQAGGTERRSGHPTGSRPVSHNRQIRPETTGFLTATAVSPQGRWLADIGRLRPVAIRSDVEQIEDCAPRRLAGGQRPDIGLRRHREHEQLSAVVEDDGVVAYCNEARVNIGVAGANHNDTLHVERIGELASHRWEER